jgi:hypothetical protein
LAVAGPLFVAVPVKVKFDPAVTGTGLLFKVTARLACVPEATTVEKVAVLSAATLSEMVFGITVAVLVIVVLAANAPTVRFRTKLPL